MQEAIAEELRFLRLRKKMTLKDSADRLNISMETLRRYENKSSGLSVEKLEQLLKFYEIDISIFFKNVCANMQHLN